MDRSIGLTPGSRRQDHTTSPSTCRAYSSARVFLALTRQASIASRAQRFVTIAKRPSGGLRVRANYFRFAELSSRFSDYWNAGRGGFDQPEIVGESSSAGQQPLR